MSIGWCNVRTKTLAIVKCCRELAPGDGLTELLVHVQCK